MIEQELPSEKVIREMKFPKKDKWKIVAIVLIIVCIGAGIYFTLKDYIAPYFREQGWNSLIIYINQNQVVPVLNQTGNVNWKTIQIINTGEGGSNP